MSKSNPQGVTCQFPGLHGRFGGNWLFTLLTCLFLLLLNGCASPQPSSTRAQPTSSSNTASNHVSRAAAQALATGQGTIAVADPLKSAAAVPSTPFEGAGWETLFNGLDLTGWKETPFAGHGEIECRFGLLLLNMGDPFTGVNYTNNFPTINYEVALDAMRVNGADFFCGMTVPVGNSFCSLIVGGWGGSLVGISSLDGADASENETTKYVQFESGRWYRIRLRVTSNRIEGWLDSKKLIDINTEGKKISLRPGDIELSKPFGLACWQTTAALRNIKLRRVDVPADPPKKEF